MLACCLLDLRGEGCGNIYMCVCVCVCIHIYIYVCVCVCVCVCVYGCWGGGSKTPCLSNWQPIL